ncbi:MAG: lysophospholipid acyltransferase family protein [Pseudomonadota bacterium]
MSWIRAVWIVVSVLFITIALLPAHAAAMVARSPFQKRTALIWHRCVARIFGLRIHVEGEQHRSTKTGTLYVANHVSWLDIVVLGAVLQTSFIAKSEVRSWPLFGWLARLQSTTFVDRNRRTKVHDQSNAIRQRLLNGDNLVLFPEGTTTDGNYVYPFNSSLFAAIATGVEGDHIAVQPLSIAYNGQGGLPMGRQWRPLAAWGGTVTLGEHLPGVLRDGLFDVQIRFGPVIKDAQMQTRKQICAQLEQHIRQMTAKGLRGEPVSSKPAEKALEGAA